jgi:hypothetical protein
LEPLSEQIREIRQRAAEAGYDQPTDFSEYAKEREAWALSVGWR